MSEDSYSVYPTYTLLHIFTYYNIIQGTYSDTYLRHFLPLLHHVCGRSVEWDTFI